eukprot:361102-Chlamydomonas_euryale.AAC.4
MGGGMIISSAQQGWDRRPPPRKESKNCKGGCSAHTARAPRRGSVPPSKRQGIRGGGEGGEGVNCKRRFSRRPATCAGDEERGEGTVRGIGTD